MQQAVSDQVPEGDIAARQALMRTCSQASEAELDAAIAGLGQLPAHIVARPPETGLVMIRGRIGGTGQPFNVGEVTVTRAAVRLATGELGAGYVLGRSLHKARSSALIDALGQRAEYRQALQCSLVTPVAERVAREHRAQQHETDATRVDFFTLVRGED